MEQMATFAEDNITRKVAINTNTLLLEPDLDDQHINVVACVQSVHVTHW
jgi:hypothetical protein